LSLLRFAGRAPLVLLWIACGLLAVALAYPWAGAAARARMNRNWSRALLALCGIAARVQGRPLLDGPVLWVVNHVSWIDIFVINSVRATAFVAKSEIRRWPAIGWLAAGAGTLFIQRGQRHAVRAVGRAMQARFARGEAVGLFPEGTTSEGLDVGPFHSSLFEPARLAGVAVQPVALRFLHQGRRSGYAAFVGEETLVANLWRVLGARGIAVDVVFLPALPAAGGDGAACSRTEWVAGARQAIRGEITGDGMPAEAGQPAPGP